MQHLNDDMDEQFRQAAEDYPLNTGNSDWNKVAAALSEDEKSLVVPRKKYRRFSWLLVVLPVMFIITAIVYPELFQTSPVSGSATNQNATLIKQQPAGNKVQDEPGTSIGVAAKAAKLSPDSVTTMMHYQATPASNPDNAAIVNNDGRIIRGNDDHNNIDAGTKNVVNATSENAGNRYGPKGGAGSGNATMPGDHSTEADGAGEAIGDLNPFTKNAYLSKLDPPDLTRTKIPGTTKISAGPIIRQKQHIKRFYVGVIGGFDITTVSLQKISKLGSHFGAMAGYSISRRLSIETGFFVERKYYYTTGSYFDKSGTSINPGWTIVSVDGSCKMFEVPVSLKYNITNTFKSNFFVTGGFSSYFMKNEDYSILVRYGPGGPAASHNYPYKNGSVNLFSELRLTGGYAWKLPRQLTLRVEPYLNIPMTGVGTGKLNLTSGGVNAGILKSIF